MYLIAIHVYVLTYIYVNTCMSAYMCMYSYTYMWTHVNLHTRVYIFIYICTFTQLNSTRFTNGKRDMTASRYEVCVRIHIHTYTHTKNMYLYKLFVLRFDFSTRARSETKAPLQSPVKIGLFRPVKTGFFHPMKTGLFHPIRMYSTDIHPPGHTSKRWLTQCGEDAQDALSCRSLFSKESLIIGLFCGKRPVKIRHPMSLRHPVRLVECLIFSFIFRKRAL